MKASDLIKDVELSLEDLATLTEEAKRSEEVLAYLDFTSKFHNYSFYNTLSIFSLPHSYPSSRFATWKKFGRHVRKGERESHLSFF